MPKTCVSPCLPMIMHIMHDLNVHMHAEESERTITFTQHSPLPATTESNLDEKLAQLIGVEFCTLGNRSWRKSWSQLKIERTPRARKSEQRGIAASLKQLH